MSFNSFLIAAGAIYTPTIIELKFYLLIPFRLLPLTLRG